MLTAFPTHHASARTHYVAAPVRVRAEGQWDDERVSGVCDRHRCRVETARASAAVADDRPERHIPTSRESHSQRIEHPRDWRLLFVRASRGYGVPHHKSPKKELRA